MPRSLTLSILCVAALAGCPTQSGECPEPETDLPTWEEIEERRKQIRV